MFKKLILVIVAVAMAAIAFICANSSASNDKQMAYGGIFENNRYRNSSIGIEADLSDGWVYFDKINTSEVSAFSFAESANWINMTDEKILFLALKPGLVTIVSYDDEMFSKEFINEANMKYLAEYACEAIPENNETAEILEYGKMYGVDNFYYFSIKVNTHKNESREYIFAYTNTSKGGLQYFAVSEKNKGIDIVKDFIKYNLTVRDTISEISM